MTDVTKAEFPNLKNLEWNYTPKNGFTDEFVPVRIFEDFDRSSLKNLKLHMIFPIVKQIQTYSLGFFVSDILTALTIASILIPQSIAYATLAGVPTIMSLTSAVFPLIIYSIFGASKHLAVGPEAMACVLLSAGIHDVSAVEMDSASIAGFITLMVGILLVLLAVFQAGYLENIIGGYILTGFVLNVSVLIMIEQIPGLLGYHISHSDETATYSTFQTAQSVFHEIHSTHWKTFWVSIASIAYLLLNKLIKKLFGHKSTIIKKFPGVLTLLIIATTLSYFLDFNSSGIEILGTFDNKLVAPKSPPFNVDLLSKLLAIIVTISIVGFIESQTPTRKFGLKYGYYPSGNRELFALGIVNIVGSFLGCYVTFGSLPRSRIQANSGGKTNLAGLFAALIVLLLFTTFSSALQYIPKCTIAAIVFNAAVDLIEYHEIHFIFKMHRWKDFILLISSFSFTFFIDLQNGILLCIVVALLLILRKSTRIQIIQYGFSLEANRYVNKEEFSDAQLEDGVFILGLRGSVGFFNVGQLKQELNRYTKHENITFHKIVLQEDIQDQFGNERFKSLMGLQNTERHIESALILDFSQLTSIDSAAVYTLGKNVRYLIEKESFRVLFCGIVNEDAKTLLYRAELIHDKNPIECNIFKDIEQAVDHVRNSRNALHHFKF